MIVALALAGAVIATVGGVLKARATDRIARLGQFMLWAGYAMSATSVILFIIAGFTSSAPG